MPPRLNRPRALVLDGQSTAAIEVLQALGRARVDVDVASNTKDCLCFRSRYCLERLDQPSAADASAFLAWLDGVMAATPYGLVVPCTENSLVALNHVPDDHLLRARALLPPRHQVDIALSKQLTWELAAKLGLGVPQSRLVTRDEESDSQFGYPIVLKPTQSLTRQGDQLVRESVVIAPNRAVYRQALSRLLSQGDVQEQSYVRGRGIGIECLYFHGRLLWYFAHERIHEVPLTGGGSSYRKSIRPPIDAILAAKQLLDSLNWHGVAMVEFKLKSDSGICLMEINPRLWGSIALAIDAGVNFPLAVWKIAAREHLGPQPKYRVPYYSRHIARDIDWMKENWRASRADNLLLTKPRLRSLLEYFRPLALIESWDHFDIRDLRVIVHQLATAAREEIGTSLKRKWQEWNLRRKMRRAHRKVVANVSPQLRSVLFVCYGNICRSAFAEVYARSTLAGIAVESAGFHSVERRPSPQHLVHAAGRLGVDMRDWRSTRITNSMIERADLILVMDEQNYATLLDLFPSSADRVGVLGLFAVPPFLSIEDPYLSTDDETEKVLQLVRRSVDGLRDAISVTSSDAARRSA